MSMDNIVKSLGSQEIASNEAAFRLWVMEHMTELGTKMEMLVGNGQPGRVTLAEQRLSRVEGKLWAFTGAAIVISVMVKAVLA